MRVLQLIDSLDAGGAERMAVSLANGLAQYIEKSYLCATRKEGILKNDISETVGYLFLHRKRTLDPGAVMRLRSYVKRNKIGVIHAHGTSFFMATQVKLLHPKIRLIWHAHYGHRATTSREQNKPLYYCSRNFDGIVTVNTDLKQWCMDTLKAKKVVYVPNFVPSERFLEAHKERKNEIVCVANLKEPKNHMNLLKAFQQVHTAFPEWQLLLIGKDFNDAYSKELTEFCLEHGMDASVLRLGQRDDVSQILSSCAIGVLSSDNEGLPMALLEYGAAGLAVAITNVGQCAAVVKEHGKVVPPNNPDALANALIAYISDEDIRKKEGKRYRKHVLETYSEKAVIPQLLELY
ncbi:MAG: glycosyltransferase family 4 protein [Flavobacteriaceae bacterium]|nr:glycosyltransferase family 4 protein [Flavobacteriaceae bacterium]